MSSTLQYAESMPGTTAHDVPVGRTRGGEHKVERNAIAPQKGYVLVPKYIEHDRIGSFSTTCLVVCFPFLSTLGITIGVIPTHGSL